MSEFHTDAMADLFGDPVALAELQFEAALRLCGACRDYHATWPYRRLARVLIGLEADAPVLESVLRDAVPQGGNILIAGASDAGLLALMARATSGLNPSITVADRCETPLQICIRYAKSRRTELTVLKTDLAVATVWQRFDLIFMHGFLRFMPEAARGAMFRSLRTWLAPRGRIIVSEMLPVNLAPKPRDEDYVDLVLSALRGRHVPLPEEEKLFRLRLEAGAGLLKARLAGAASHAGLRCHLAEAGFAIDLYTEYSRNVASDVPDISLVSKASLLAVASRMKED
jgi:hypothetical protein